MTTKLHNINKKSTLDTSYEQRHGGMRILQESSLPGNVEPEHGMIEQEDLLASQRKPKIIENVITETENISKGSIPNQ
jgi:hypothetical protein